MIYVSIAAAHIYFELGKIIEKFFSAIIIKNYTNYMRVYISSTIGASSTGFFIPLEQYISIYIYRASAQPERERERRISWNFILCGRIHNAVTFFQSPEVLL